MVSTNFSAIPRTMNENQRCYIVNRAHKDTEFSAVVQKSLFFRNLQTKLQTINHGSLWYL